MTIFEFYDNNVPDDDGKVPVLIFRNPETNVDASLYILKGKNNRWGVKHDRSSGWDDVLPGNPLFPIVSEWLDEHFGEDAYAQELDLSECFNEIFGQLQSTCYAVDIRSTSLYSVIENTAWELAQEGFSFAPGVEAPPFDSSFDCVDVLLVFDSQKIGKLAEVFETEDIDFCSVSTLQDAIAFCEHIIPALIFCDARALTTQTLKDLRGLREIQPGASKLVSIVDESSPFQDDIQEICDDTYMEPVEDQTYLRYVHKYKEEGGGLDRSLGNHLSDINFPRTLDVLLIYDQDAIDYMMDIFDSELISAHGVLSLRDALDFGRSKIPSVVLLDAKNLHPEDLTHFKDFCQTNNDRTKIFSFVTEQSPFEEEIRLLSTDVFRIPVKTSTIMKCVHQNI
ncbi:MAG: hypothetical protein O3B73_01760 [bacterium]|jgi:hypothetical protein|nr:hypothetical protein [bacterium]